MTKQQPRAPAVRRYIIAGVELSREEVIHKYLHLVKYVAGRISMHFPSSVDINDLINDGVFGLMDAIEKYDGSRAVKFETYAVTRINGAILDALRHSIGFRAPCGSARASWSARLKSSRWSTAARRRAKSWPRSWAVPAELDHLIQRVRGTSLVSLEELLPQSSRRRHSAGRDARRRTQRRHQRSRA